MVFESPYDALFKKKVIFDMLEGGTKVLQLSFRGEGSGDPRKRTVVTASNVPNQETTNDRDKTTTSYSRKTSPLPRCNAGAPASSPDHMMPEQQMYFSYFLFNH